ncbi:MAG: DNA mismatch repair protein MutS [Flavobacteriaceae bacterium]
MAKAGKETPLMKQYNQIKHKYPDALLLFRVGDFYETFGQDAVRAAKILGILLTKRGAGSTSETELAGFPHHSLNTYLPKLVRAGCRVAICDQLEDPKQAKKIVKRGVTELVTPGVTLNEEVLEQQKNNYLAALYALKDRVGVSFLDISTGDFWVAQGSWEQVQHHLSHLQPSELLLPKPQKQKWAKDYPTALPVSYLEDWVFDPPSAQDRLLDHFKMQSLKGFGVENQHLGIAPAGAILHYLSETQHDRLGHLTKIQPIDHDTYVWMDRFTIRNLELFAPSHVGGKALIDVLDQTQTPMGGRCMRRWLSFPLKDLSAIQDRLEAVDALVKPNACFEALEDPLKNMVDLERVMARIATAKIHPRALVQLLQSIERIQEIKVLLQTAEAKALQNLGKQLLACADLQQLLQQRLHPEAPVLLSKGMVIAEGYSEALDELRNLKNSGQDFLDQMLTRETERTQIPSLKIAFNNVFGYYIEVRNTHKDRVPEEWIRKQTLVNAERYITEELKEYESKILGAEEKIKILEAELYATLLQDLQVHLESLKTNAEALARLDCLWSFAAIAKKQDYSRPEINTSTALKIKGGRHPVIEQQLPLGTPYIANDLQLDREKQQLVMITGPNMSGKSAILRQTALITLMAQMGSFVPATQASIGLIDKLFTRVGASDNISMGESTFMVEMNETAAILNNISSQSLVLLDEIGRGTSTYDGISIAWAIAEYLHEHPFKPKVLFATHYHELNRMTDRFERIRNYNVAVKEMKDKVLFLRKLVPGGSAHSFGIHVAKMAGVPQHVWQTAEKKLQQLESQNETAKNAAKIADEPMQLSFFQLDDPLMEELRQSIQELDIDTITPIEALMKLNEIRRMLQQKSS